VSGLVGGLTTQVGQKVFHFDQVLVSRTRARTEDGAAGIRTLVITVNLPPELWLGVGNGVLRRDAVMVVDGEADFLYGG